jgi:hypothetical protein
LVWNFSGFDKLVSNKTFDVVVEQIKLFLPKLIDQFLSRDFTKILNKNQCSITFCFVISQSVKG